MTFPIVWSSTEASGRGGPRAALPLMVPAFLLLVCCAPAFAQDDVAPRLVDRIVAIVDEEVILQSDVEREVELFRLEKEYAGEPVPEVTQDVRREMLERLVESKLIIAAAKSADMKVDEEAITESVEAKIQQFVEHFGSMENLRQELMRSGMTLPDYRTRMSNQLRDQQYLRLVVGKFVRPQVEVLENEIHDYYLSHLDEMPAEPDSLTIADILIPVQPSLAVRQRIQAEMAQITAALESGRPFAEVAAEYSLGPNAARGGGIGIVSRGDLFDENLERAVFALPAGGFSEPVISSRGVHVMKVTELLADGRRAISQVFLPIEIDQTDVDLAREEIEVARARVLAGEPFSLVATEVSRDAISANRGGVLGTFRLEDLSEQFQAVLKDARVGDVTEPTLTPAGWYVFVVQERVEGHMYTYDELSEQLRQVVEGREIDARLAEYVAGLRDRFFIDEKN